MRKPAAIIAAIFVTFALVYFTTARELGGSPDIVMLPPSPSPSPVPNPDPAQYLDTYAEEELPVVYISLEVIDSPYMIGDTIALGGFDWRVIDIRAGRVLVLSENVLSRRVWHHEQTTLSWEFSDIREYLNGSFYYSAFTDEEKERIIETTVVNPANSWYGAAGPGRETIDRVFLLSAEEVVQYLGDSGKFSRPGRPDSFLSDQYDSARVARDLETNVASWWWLRTTGHHLNPNLHASAVAVGGAGEVFLYGLYVIMDGGVRPAMWLSF